MSPAAASCYFPPPRAPVNLASGSTRTKSSPPAPISLISKPSTIPRLAALYATDEILREFERGALNLGRADAFAAMAPQLENLWKKLMRPPAGAVA